MNVPFVVTCGLLAMTCVILLRGRLGKHGVFRIVLIIGVIGFGYVPLNTCYIMIKQGIAGTPSAPQSGK